MSRGEVVRWLLLLVVLGSLPGCGGLRQGDAALPKAASEKKLALLGHTIQVGAFVELDNAVRLMQKLDSLGLDAYYYRHASGLYKVRFGDFSSRKEAEARAVQLRKAGVIEAFYLVAPGEFAAARYRHYQDGALRKMLVSTAEGFIGIPYEWGGESAETGFDCSGLAMTIYKLNGLNLPRNSAAQFQAGSPVRREDLAPGDLVFFATNGNAEVSHVGIYTGDGKFIHAPKKGDAIRQSSLRNGYFDGCYMGARTYLGKDG
ncbi:MAG: NlpC/P60 family protein [Deltaproteobacteria bacterium]|nr:NlpC/P60 family protein [Deltaproteobacteria bacterium]